MTMLLLCVQNDHAVIVYRMLMLLLCTECSCCYCVQNDHTVTVYRITMLVLCVQTDDVTSFHNGGVGTAHPEVTPHS